MTLVCRPTPIVRCMYRSETSSKQLMYRMAHQTGGALLLLPMGTAYPETPKQYLVVSVQMNMQSIA